MSIQRAPTRQNTERESMSQTDRVKCLIVDDIAENLIAIEALLQRDGIEFLKAHSGPEALELCSTMAMWRWPCWTCRCPR